MGTSSPDALDLPGWQGSGGCRKNTQGHKPFLHVAVASVASVVAAVAVKLKSQQTTSFNDCWQSTIINKEIGLARSIAA